MYKVASIAAVLTVTAMPAAAQTTPAAAPKANSELSDPNRIVCKKEEGIGSRLAAKKVCLTVQEWKDLAEANREHTEKVQQQSGFRTGN